MADLALLLRQVLRHGPDAVAAAAASLSDTDLTALLLATMVASDRRRASESRPVTHDLGRCAVCGWPYAYMRKGIMCERGDCSTRPRPGVLFDPVRAEEDAVNRS